jgi:hypothetical protein
MRKGKRFWRDVERDLREEILQEIARIIARTSGPSLTLFGAVIEKSAQVHAKPR